MVWCEGFTLISFIAWFADIMAQYTNMYDQCGVIAGIIKALQYDSLVMVAFYAISFDLIVLITLWIKRGRTATQNISIHVVYYIDSSTNEFIACIKFNE